jgi:hypothetical protein
VHVGLIMVAMVGIPLRQLGGLSSTDRQPFFHGTDCSQPSPSYRREDATACTLLLPSHFKAKCTRDFRCLNKRKQTQFSRQHCGGSEYDAWVLEISMGARRPDDISGYRKSAKHSFTRTAEVRTRALGNGEVERGSEERILTKNRGVEEKDQDSQEKSSEGEEGGFAGDIGAVASQATTLAGEEVAKVVAKVEEKKFEGSGGLGREASTSESGNSKSPNGEVDRRGLLDERFLRRIAAAENADAVLALIAERTAESGFAISREDCSQMILAAIAQDNVELAFSILDSMRSSLLQRRIERQEGVLSKTA